MEPGYSRLRIEDLVLPDQGATLKHSAIDVLMFMMPDGIERTMRVWDELLDSGRLRILQVWSDQSGAKPVIEAELKAIEVPLLNCRSPT